MKCSGKFVFSYCILSQLNQREFNAGRYQCYQDNAANDENWPARVDPVDQLGCDPEPGVCYGEADAEDK
jgi:hypothetical protein